MQYRRDYTKGSTYLFTLVTFKRYKLFNTPQAVQWLRMAFQNEKRRRPFLIDAIVILPDHLHAIWTLPKHDADYSIRWRNIKREFTKMVPLNQRPCVSRSRAHKNEQGIWQRRFWEHRIRDEQDYQKHIEYIRYNPVKHQYVTSPAHWPYSSIHRYIRYQIIPKNWGGHALNFSPTIGRE